MRYPLLRGLLLAPLLLLGTVAPGAAQTLWQGTRIGMSAAEIQQLYPDAVAGTHQVLSSGATDELRIPAYSFADQRFSVDFYFARDRLQRVALRLLLVESRDRRDDLAIYDRLVALLRRSEGPPSGCQTAQNITLFEGCQWQLAQSIVDVLYLDVGGQPILLDLYYQARNGAGARQL